jgi:hypothetical protein
MRRFCWKRYFGYNVGVASALPEPIQRSTPQVREEVVDELIWHLSEGRGAAQIARRIAPDDRKAQKRLRKRLRRIIANDPRIEAGVREEAQSVLMAGLIPITRALIKRMKRTGRADGAKLIFEATGFHNPRVKHEHSGEISVKIASMPRPQDVEGEAEEVQDADVVE